MEIFQLVHLLFIPIRLLAIIILLKLIKLDFALGTKQSAQITVTPLNINLSVQYLCGLNVNIIKNISTSSSTGSYVNNWYITNSSGTQIYSTNTGTNTTLNYTFQINGTYTVDYTTIVMTGPSFGTYSGSQVITINSINPLNVTASPTIICAGNACNFNCIWRINIYMVAS